MNLNIFEPIITVFNFIASLLDNIINGLTNSVTILTNFFGFLNNLISIFPSPFYQLLITFMSIYSIIFFYKLFRKG